MQVVNVYFEELTIYIVNYHFTVRLSVHDPIPLLENQNRIRVHNSALTSE